MNRHNIMRSEEITVEGQAVHAWIGGDGPALLLLHAAWGDAEMSWGGVWNELSRSFTVIAPDLPGFGRSQALPRPSFQAMAALLKQVLDALKVERAITAGNSFGAGVAMQFANASPAMVPWLVLVNGGYMPHVPAVVKKLISMRVLDQGFRRLMRHISFSQRTIRRSFAEADKLPPGFFDRILQNSPAYSEIAFDTFMNMEGPLARPEVPVRLVWGEKDRLATMRHANALQKWIPGTQLVVIRDAGHMPQLEQPQAFLTAMLSLPQMNSRGRPAVAP